MLRQQESCDKSGFTRHSSPSRKPDSQNIRVQDSREAPEQKAAHKELDMLFVEGKWFYNYVLNLHKSGVKLNRINSTTIKSIERFDKDRNKIVNRLEYIGSQQKQAIVTRMSQNERTIITLVKKGF